MEGCGVGGDDDGVERVALYKINKKQKIKKQKIFWWGGADSLQDNQSCLGFWQGGYKIELLRLLLDEQLILLEDQP